MRRSEASVNMMVKRRRATVKFVAIKIATVEIAAVVESVTVVEKGMAPGNKPYVIKTQNHRPSHSPTRPIPNQKALRWEAPLRT